MDSHGIGRTTSLENIFLCAHTWLNEDAKKAGIEAASNMTEKEFFDSVKTDKAETLAHWMSVYILIPAPIVYPREQYQ